MLSISLRTISHIRFNSTLLISEAPMIGKSFTATVLCLLTLLFALPPLLAQDEPDDASARYDTAKKDESRAAKLELLVPFAGYRYVGDALSNYVGPLVVSGAGIVAMIYGNSRCGDVDSAFDFGPCVNKGKTGYTFMLLGFAGYVAGRIWGGVTARQGAQKYNSDLRKSLNLSFAPRRGRLEVILSYAF